MALLCIHPSFPLACFLWGQGPDAVSHLDILQCVERPK